MKPDWKNLGEALDGILQVDRPTRLLYATDASAYQEIPVAVAFPKTEADIQRLILFARANQLGLIPRTAGTSLAGQVVGSGIVVDVSHHFTEILEIDPEAKTVRVQPGVVRDELNLALLPHGMLFGPETSTANRAMIGGMVGNNSCGSNSIVYGSTRDHVISLRGFLSDGTEVEFAALDAEAFQEKTAVENTGLEADLYRGVQAMLGDAAARQEIRDAFPKPGIPRRNTGYALDLLMQSAPFDSAYPETPFNFCQLLAGSEGTLFFITEITLQCAPLPPPVSGLVCAHFASVDHALQATVIAVEHQPFACELIDEHILQGAARNAEQRKNMSFVEGEPGAILVVDLRGETEASVRAASEKLTAAFQAVELGYAFPLLLGVETKKVWDLRKAGLGILGNIPGDAKPCAVIEDTAVEVADLPRYIADFNRLLHERYGLTCVHYAHAGTGEIHLRPVINLKSKAGQETFRALAKDVADLVKSYGGSLSGEHGDGRLRGEFIEGQVGLETYQRMREMKALWDPDHVFNPNKIIDTPAMNSSLRYQPDQVTPEFETVFDWSETEGLARATEMCSGSGDCRKSHLMGGTMCPTFMVTRNEKDSTRGRANLLRHAMTNQGTEQSGDWTEMPGLGEVMDRCLGCKGCRNECPSNVDLAKLKAEYLQALHDRNGMSFATKMIGSFDRLSPLASRMSWIANLGSNSRVGKRMLGIAAQRSVPKIHRQTLRKWFAGHTVHPNVRKQADILGVKAEVLLFCDEFTDVNDPQIGIAAVELLERLGYTVRIPKQVASGRAAMSKGMLHRAKQLAEQNVDLLGSLVSADTPLIGLEPSAILSFRDEVPALIDPDHGSRKAGAEKLKQHALLIDEFFQMEIDAGRIASDAFDETPREIRLHGHCHQKALSSLTATMRMLGLPAGHRVELIRSGCCGMAGSFGMEAKHVELSMAIGELVLFPSVRESLSDTLIAAPGTSCRHQIKDGTGRVAKHPIEILREAWAGD